MKPVKIVEIGGEGGGITLFGWKTDRGEWCFLRETNERTLIGMMPDDDVGGVGFQSGSASVTNWNEALEILSVYPWQHLYPLYVHPEFADLVWKEIENVEEECYCRSEWEEVCGRRSISY